MWQYNNTIYPDDELYHWKYIRKYKKNGKWRYVYPNDKYGIKEKISTKITGQAYRQHEEEDAKKSSQFSEAAYGAYRKIPDTSFGSKDREKAEWDLYYNRTMSKIYSTKASRVGREYYSSSLVGLLKSNLSDIKKKAHDKAIAFIDKVLG